MPHSAQDENESLAKNDVSHAIAFSATSPDAKSPQPSNGCQAASNGHGKRRSGSSMPRSGFWFTRPIVLGIVFAVGLLLLTIGVILSCVFPGVFRRRIASTMPLVNGSVTFKSWSSPGAPIYMQFWLFNITNPAEFMSGQKPVVRQVGPFTYAESRVKLNVRFDDANSSLTYKQATYYHFRRDMSCCFEDVQVTTLNLPYVTITYKTRFVSKYVINTLNSFFINGGHKLLVTRQVKELLWGYKDTALATMAPMARLAGIKINPVVGLFAGKNGSDGGEYSVHTGVSDLNRLATILSWRGSSKLDCWSSAQANMINGSDGAMFPPFVSQSDRLYLFSSDIFRSIYLTYTEDVLLHGAVPLYRFQAPAAMFMNSTLNPDNAGFCVQGVCLDSGVLNMSGCVPGVPAVMSQPHFYQAAAQYQDAVLGIKPGPEFDTLLDIEPNTGIVMRAAKKLQINMAVFPVKGYKELDGLNQTLIMPVLWINESASLDAGSAGKFRDAVLKPKASVKSAQWVLISSGLLLSLLAAALAVAVHGRQLITCAAEADTAVELQDPERSDLNLLTDCKSTATTPTATGAAAIGAGA